MNDIYNHMIDLAFSIETIMDEDEVLSKSNLSALLERARARLDDIEKLGDIEAFGLCDTYIVASIES